MWSESVMWSEGVIMIARATMMERPGSSTRADRTRGSVRVLHHLTASPSRRTIVTLRSFALQCATGMTLFGAIFPAILACVSDQVSPAQQ
jgi:hypothetical protein